jgi:TorA maturation chaperone TorD
LAEGLGAEGAHALTSRAYSLLAIILLNPDDFISEVKTRVDEIKKIDLALLDSIGCNECADVLDGLLKALSEILADERRLDEFGTDYANVLLPKPEGTLCPLYESVYVLGRKATIGDPRVAESLREFYSVAGLDVKKGPGIMPDYAPVELEFLAALHEYEFIALKEGMNLETLKALRGFRLEFVLSHPARWMKKLGECIENNAKTNVLKLTGELLKCLIECEDKY